MGIDTRRVPAAAHPDVAEAVGTAGLIRALYGDELTKQTLPKVEAVLGRVEGGIGLGDEIDGIRNPKDAADIEAGVVLRRGREGVDSNDKRLDGVAAGANDDVGGTAELGELNVVLVGSKVFRLALVIAVFVIEVGAHLYISMRPSSETKSPTLTLLMMLLPKT